MTSRPRVLRAYDPAAAGLLTELLLAFLARLPRA